MVPKLIIQMQTTITKATRSKAVTSKNKSITYTSPQFQIQTHNS